MKLPFETPVELETALTQQEVYVRLRDAVPGRFPFFLSKVEYPVRGVVKREECWLEARSSYYNNSFQRRLTLNFVPSSDGTKLIGAFQPRTATVLFMIFWFGFLGIFSVIWIFGWIQTAFHWLNGTAGGVFAGTPWLWSFHPLAMVLFGYLLLRFGLWLSKRTEPDVIDFVNEVLSRPPTQTPRIPTDSTSGDAEFSEELVIRPRHEIPQP